MPHGLTVNIRYDPGYALVTPAGELDIATAPELRQIQQDRALLLCERIPPALVALRPWYKDAALKKLAA